MDRRAFIAATASVATISTAGRALAARREPLNPARHVRLEGWLSPVLDGPGHYYVLSPTPGGRDPASPNLRDWPEGLVRVYPANVRAMRAGKVTLRGQLHTGKYGDTATGHVAGVVLTDATLV